MVVVLLLTVDEVGLYEAGDIVLAVFAGVFNPLATSKYFWRWKCLGSGWRNFSLVSKWG